jgi:hypothetical protein
MHGVDPDERTLDLDQLEVSGSLRPGRRAADSHTGEPGASSPSMRPGFGQCTVTRRSPSSATSARKRL